MYTIRVKGRVEECVIETLQKDEVAWSASFFCFDIYETLCRTVLQISDVGEDVEGIREISRWTV